VPGLMPAACCSMRWLQFNRRTLRGTWDRAQGLGSRAAGGKASEAHETVNSVVSRILQAEGVRMSCRCGVWGLGRAGQRNRQLPPLQAQKRQQQQQQQQLVCRL